MTIRLAENFEYPQVLAHYEACNYKGGLNENDQVILAIDLDIIGAVRLCIENDVKVLRGMYIKTGFRRKGIGASLLTYLKDHTAMEGCYCLPYRHLKKFYGIIGFEEITAQAAPEFLAERFQRYSGAGGKDVIIMQIKKQTK